MKRTGSCVLRDADWILVTGSNHGHRPLQGTDDKPLGQTWTDRVLVVWPVQQACGQHPCRASDRLLTSQVGRCLEDRPRHSAVRDPSGGVITASAGCDDKTHGQRTSPLINLLPQQMKRCWRRIFNDKSVHRDVRNVIVGRRTLHRLWTGLWTSKIFAVPPARCASLIDVSLIDAPLIDDP